VSAPITIEAAALARSMKYAAALIESSSHVAITNNVRLAADGDVLEITTTNFQVEHREKLPISPGDPFVASVDAKRLCAVAASVGRGASLSLEIDDQRLSVKAGRSRWALPILSADNFPTLSLGDAEAVVAIPAAEIKAALARTMWATSNEIMRFWLAGPLLHSENGKAALVALDGSVLARVITSADHPKDAPEVIVGPKFARALQSLCAEIGAATLTGKLIDATFPDYRRVIPPECDRLIVDPGAMASALRRVMLVSTERTRVVKFGRSADKVTLSAADIHGGTANEEVPADSGSDERDCGFDARYLSAMLEAVGGDSVEIHHADPGAPALIRRVVPDGMIGVMMPYRI
jgi:DNA polymerase-3 subunit beta